jgi:limonene-1,2-epoxide hydrolase
LIKEGKKMTNTAKRLTRRNFSKGGLAGLAALWLPAPSPAQAAASEGKNVSANEQRANVKVVEDFCAAFAKKDLDTIASSLADPCTYRITQTRPPIVGKDKVMEQIRTIIGAASFKVLKTVALGPIVLNERDETLIVPNPTAPRTIRVAVGMFFVENGKIVEWTDYVFE